MDENFKQQKNSQATHLVHEHAKHLSVDCQCL